MRASFFRKAAVVLSSDVKSNWANGVSAHFCQAAVQSAVLVQTSSLSSTCTSKGCPGAHPGHALMLLLLLHRGDD